MPSRGWTCRFIGCGTLNEPAKKKCGACGHARPRKRTPKHKEALRWSYEFYLDWQQDIHGVGEECGVCGRPPKARRLDRDHDHATGNPRGLLCARCNQRLERGSDTQEWLGAALAYIKRANDYWAAESEMDEEAA